MIYRRKTYRVHPDRLSMFNKVFHEYILPSNLRHGAKLVGRWLSQDREICEIWEYPNQAAYKQIEKRVKKDLLIRKAQALLQDIESIGCTYEEDELVTTGSYAIPKHIISVSGYITNAEGKVLLVKTHWREDTWELPGGGVDDGETLDQALRREINEETGIQVNLQGISGVYSNGNVVAVVFTGTYLKGQLKTSKETKMVEFKQIDESNIDTYITRPKYKPRVLDAIKGHCIPFEAFQVRPFKQIQRLENDTP